MQWKKINIFLRAEGILQPSVSQNIKLLSAPGVGICSISVQNVKFGVHRLEDFCGGKRQKHLMAISERAALLRADRQVFFFFFFFESRHFRQEAAD